MTNYPVRLPSLSNRIPALRTSQNCIERLNKNDGAVTGTSKYDSTPARRAPAPVSLTSSNLRKANPPMYSTHSPSLARQRSGTRHDRFTSSCRGRIYPSCLSSAHAHSPRRLPHSRPPSRIGGLSRGDLASLVHARVLGYLLLYPPSQEARRSLVLDLASWQRADVNKRHEAVVELGAKYLKHFISIFRKSPADTPTPSSYPSPPSFHRAAEDCPEDLQRVPRDHSRAKASALVRDNYRCMVTGVPDMDAVSLNLTPASPDGDFTVTRCSYIFPEALGNMEVAGATAKVRSASAAISVVSIANGAGAAPGA
ncbi:hypothetical protein NUW54_g12032 [Trametes sanguinea]|uniref:Uncharacterized protein n=1 Tax=Trametes sanguinea TaxID=158606 RepID=A0ACC1N2X0_9APHY|nr:hypothetical protein NUW54_g12032 [Trametes sanguinea]